MILPIKKFSYQVDIEGVPYRIDTAQQIFGGDYIPEYPEDIAVQEIMHDLVKDAICYVLQSKSNFIAQHKIEDIDKLEGNNKEFWLWLEAKEQRYRQIESTIKPLNI